MKFIVAGLLFSSMTFANCYEYNNSNTAVKWTAYKTAKKAGVGGAFKKFEIKTQKKQGSIKELVKGARFTIDVNSVHTKDASRDAKIERFFFKDMKISGVVNKIDSNYLYVDMTLAGKTMKVPMKYDIEDGELEAEGIIDVLDFALGENLAAINKACYALHEGKTWSDVQIEIESKFSKCN
ncbi:MULTISPECIES: YceI family protein [Halobacteriovorax]|uniref:YceI family protein n=1 Tax=Halobacteriovorax vibrionivorans TaxID=2152716 RepID=A0ABY0II87_9BACT|nr:MULTISPECIES: YceI family protein [Halobacteriovorax]RZF21052.1 YceI family protein [Halobacteriovorax vibrionivorans]TGD48067.1 YceI family protein [Halobacteriovorax sp. Y22]